MIRSFLLLFPTTLVSASLSHSSTIKKTPLTASSQLPPFRPPAIPLIVQDPFISIWANGTADGGKSHSLGSDYTHHWSAGALQEPGSPYRDPTLGIDTLFGLVKVTEVSSSNGKTTSGKTPSGKSTGNVECFRFLGGGTNFTSKLPIGHHDLATESCNQVLTPVSSKVYATNSYFTFEQPLNNMSGKEEEEKDKDNQLVLKFKARFTTPSFMRDMVDDKSGDVFKAKDMVNIPLTFVSFEGYIEETKNHHETNNNKYEISVYFEHGAEIVTNRAAEPVEFTVDSYDGNNHPHASRIRLATDARKKKRMN